MDSRSWRAQKLSRMNCRRPESSTKPTVSLKLAAMLLIMCELCPKLCQSSDELAAEQLLAGASEPNLLLSSESHKIVASGWPSTSPMWPTIDTDEDADASSAGQEAASAKGRQWFRMIEPFIYADKPRTGDYSLLLKINNTVLEALRAHLKPALVSLSFEYYFNHDPKSTALPLIKIEVNRKELKYLDPSGQNARARRWTKFNERIPIVELAQLEKPDWLKISLVNRDVPSIVAIRRLQAEFRMSPESNSPNEPTKDLRVPPASLPAEPPASRPPAQEEPGSNQYVPPAPARQQPSTVVVDEGVANEPPAAEYPAQQPGQPLAPLAPPPQELVEPGAGESDLAAADQPGSAAAGPQQDLLQPAASDTRHKKSKPQTTQEPPAPDASLATSASELLSSTIKPVTPAKKKGWGWPTGRRRRRRDTSAAASALATTNATVITLTCQRSDQCEWLSDTKDEGIQWSLARMPTLTSSVQAGYYYVSNRNNYGDSSKLLRVSLNQTERATVADQNSDHCIELAVYVTERTFLRMYQLTRAPSSGGGAADGAATSSTGEQSEADWIRGSLLLSWAPTMALNDSSASATDRDGSTTRRRLSLAGSRLAAMESGQNGWTMETLCFGDFFARAKDCGAGKCAFGFIMDTLDGSSSSSSSPSVASAANSSPSATGADKSDAGGQIGPAPSVAADAASAEQVVGVSILREYSRNVPLQSARPKWLETWQRNEVEPGDGWRFYPKLDFQVGGENVSMVNLFDEAQYFVESDWLHVDDHLDLTATLLARDESGRNLSHHEDSAIQQQQQQLDGNVFTLRVKSRLVDSSFRDIFANETSIDWNIYTTLNGSSSLSLSMSITDQLRAARGGQLRRETENADEDLFKVVLEFVLDLHWLAGADELPASSQMSQYLNGHGGARFSLVLANVSISDRCFPNPCEHGSCQQNGTGSQDWNCKCDDKYRGRRCEFGHWCNVAHVAPWNPAPTGAGQKAQVVALAAAGARAPKLVGGEGGATPRITGEQFCRSKLGQGYKCADIDLPLNDNLYTDEDKTFYCSCRSDFYLADDSRCRPAHACNSVLCPSMSMICDESKPFNHTQPCHCNEKQDWFPNPEPIEPGGNGGGGGGSTTRPACVRRQCHDKQRDCGFDAHLCIPTVPGERPICKCGPKFALKTDERTGKQHCQSTACVLPTLNDCQQICVPDNSTNTTRPYTCACHPGYQLDSDNRSCKLERASSKAPLCKPACPSDSQICTDHGCRCKQGFVGEGEVKVRRAPKANKSSSGNANSTYFDYTESIRCLNICSLSYAENKEEFEMVESVCPLGLCDPSTFQCRCSDPSSVSLANEKYEPIYANCSRRLSEGDHEAGAKPKPGQSQSSEANGEGDGGDDEEDDLQLTRVSPLCHLKRVCEPDSSGYKICKSQGAICVPDYTKPTKFDCICPPSTEKRLYGQGSVSEFSCESKCSAKRSDCLRKQAVCKQVDRDQVRCECLPGFMLQENNVCYLAKYSYSMNLIVVNKYYEPEARFHRLLELNSTSSSIGNANWPGQFASSASSLCPPKKIPSKSHDQQHQLSNTAQEDQEQLNEIVPQFNKLEGKSSSMKSATKMIKSIFIPDYNQCNITQIIPKSLIDDPYEHDFESYMGYIEQCNEKIHQNMRNYQLNSRLSEDVRQSLRQHLRDFTVTTNSSSCVELDSSGMLLNCTIYLQSNEPIDGESTINSVFGDCDKNAHDDRYCWIKPRLLLVKKSQPESAQTRSQSNQTSSESQISEVNKYNFKQIVPCEINNFCGPDAISTRLDERTSLCSCKCPADVEVIDVKDLEPRRHDDLEPSKVAIKEICAPRNLCGANSTHCILKTGSVCQYDIRTGSRCICVYPSYEDSTGRCVEVAFSQLDNTLIIIIIMLGTALLVSVFLNILVAARTKSMFGRSKQYPLNEFSSPASRPMNRSTGVPNPVFEND